MNKRITNKVLSVALLLFVSMIWGFAFVAQRVATGAVGAYAFTGIRFCLGAIVVLPVTLIFERERLDKQKRKLTYLYSALSGIVMFLACLTQQMGVEITQNAGKSGFITALYTVLVPIASAIIYKQKKGVNVWMGAVLAMVGLFLLSVNETFTVGIGEILLFLCAVLWTAQILIVDVSMQKGVPPLKFSMYQFFVCGIVGVVLALFIEPESFTVDALSEAMIPILYAGVLSVGVAFTLQSVAQKRSDPTTAAIIFSTEALFGTIGGAIILHEVMSLRAYIGCAVMFFGLVLSQIDIKKDKIQEKLRDE